MVERQYYCISCQVTRRAKVWNRWTGAQGSHQSEWWLCEKCHATLPRKVAATWEPDTDWGNDTRSRPDSLALNEQLAEAQRGGHPREVVHAVRIDARRSAGSL